MGQGLAHSIDLYRPKCTTEHRRNLKINDLVLLVDGDVPRGSWPSAVLQQVFPSTDGVLRRVKLRKIITRYFDNFGWLMLVKRGSAKSRYY